MFSFLISIFSVDCKNFVYSDPLLNLCIYTPAQSRESQYITAPEVKDLIEKDPRVVLINVLSTIEYDGLHITDSINIPITEFRNSALLPKNLDTPIITYCMGKH